MPLHRPKVRASRASISLAIVLCMSACGGGDSTAERKFTNFQAATLAIGQPDLVSGQPNQAQGPSASSLNAPYGLALTPAGGLLVADRVNNRVLHFASMPVATGAGADAVLGQPNFHSTAPSASRNGLNAPGGVAIGAGRMVVADSHSNRVLIYDAIPAAGAPLPEPTAVLGQPDFQSSAASCGPGGLSLPNGVFISPQGKLLVADTGNSRLLVWNSIPAAGTFAVAPDLVLGQSDLDHCAFRDHDQDGESDRLGQLVVDRATDKSMEPVEVWTDGNRLAVSDATSNRVLIWKTFPTADFQPADVVLGHANFISTEFNDGQPFNGIAKQPTARSLAQPQGIHSDGIGLAVADTLNNRVLIWNSFPQESNQPADVVLGQAAFDQHAAEDTNQDGIPERPPTPHARGFYLPLSVLLTPEAILTSDFGNNRVLVFHKQ